jgi:uncharacterized protein YxjI
MCETGGARTRSSGRAGSPGTISPVLGGVVRDGRTVATVHKALVGIRARFAIELDDGADLKAHGNVVDHEYEIERDGDTVAQVSKRWFRVRDTYGVEIENGEDVGLVLATVVALESLTDEN